MKTLYLLRHAHTFTDPPPGKGDHERVLSPQGTAEAKAVGTFMKEHGLMPQLVLSSSATRTMQTTQLALEALRAQPPCRFGQNLYHASAGAMLAQVQETEDTVSRILMVAHNPGVAELALRLGDVDNYAPATLTVFTGDCDVWKDFSQETVKLEKICVPKT